jgi:hypothetical protein
VLEGSKSTMSLSVPQEGRNELVDACRGVCIFSMLLVHLGSGPSAFRFSISGVLGFLSGAEGFMFISGLVFAKLYGHRLGDLGSNVTAKLVLKRWLQFYLLHLFCMVCTIVTAQWMSGALVGEDVEFQLAVSSPWIALGRAVALRYYPMHLGILPLYVYYIPFAWLIVWRGWAHRIWVPVISTLLWAAQYSPVSVFRDVTMCGPLSPFGYQVLFFLGLWFGSLRDNALSLAKPTNRVLLGIAVMVSVGCFLASHPRLFLPDDQVVALRRWLEWPLDKVTVGWVRIVDFLGVAYVVYALRSWLSKLPLEIFGAMGRHSMGIFIGHIIFFLSFCEINARVRRFSVSVFNAYILACVVAVTLVFWGASRIGATRSMRKSEPNGRASAAM